LKIRSDRSALDYFVCFMLVHIEDYFCSRPDRGGGGAPRQAPVPTRKKPVHAEPSPGAVTPRMLLNADGHDAYKNGVQILKILKWRLRNRRAVLSMSWVWWSRLPRFDGTGPDRRKFLRARQFFSLLSYIHYSVLKIFFYSYVVKHDTRLSLTPNSSMFSMLEKRTF
jgi:hypothetical protein